MRRVVFLACAVLLGCRSMPVSEQPVVKAAATESPPVAEWVRTPPPPPMNRVRSAVPAVTRKTLPNGLHIVILEHHRRPVVTVSLVLLHGSLGDPPEREGLTNMAVKLASDFYEPEGAGGPEDDRSFRMRVARMGGSAVFEVDADSSVVRIAGYAQDATKYLQLIAEAVRTPRHGTNSFDARRNAALDFIEDVESTDSEAVRQLLDRSAFGPDHLYARSTIGTTKSLTALRLKEVIEQQPRVFSPAGATLLVVGDVRPSQVLTDASAAFGLWAGPAEPVERVPRPALPRDSRDVRYLERPSASTLFTCAARPLPEVAGTDASLRVLVSVLGQGVGSRLSSRLRNSQGLTYNASATIVRRRQASALVSCSALAGKESALGARSFREVLAGLRESPPTDEEIARAKGLWLAEIDSSFDNVDKATATWLEAIELGNGTPRLEQDRAAIERVTAAEVKELAARLFTLDRFRWVVSGDHAAAARAFEASGFGKLKTAPGGAE